jgi:hypothetical protein
MFSSSLLPAFQPSQSLSCIINLNHTRISVFPEVEQFLVVLYGFSCVALLFVDLAKTETCAIRIIRMTLWAFSNHSLPFQISGKRISTNKEKSNIQRDEEEMESGLTFCLLSIDSISIKEILQVGLMNQAPTSTG